jgi:hypothetical protein
MALACEVVVELQVLVLVSLAVGYLLVMELMSADLVALILLVFLTLRLDLRMAVPQKLLLSLCPRFSASLRFLLASFFAGTVTKLDCVRFPLL